MRSDDWTFATYRGHNHALARGTSMGRALRGAVRPRRRPDGRQGRLDAHHERRAPHDGQLRDRRRPPADRARGRLVRPVPRHRAGRRVLLRRRDDQHRRVPRGAQPGRRLEGAGRVRVREQPVHGVHGDRQRDRGRAARGRPGERLRPGADRGRRQRRGRGVRGRDDGPGPGARRRGAVADRGRDLPPRRPLAGGSRQVPPGRRGAGVAGQGPGPDAIGRAWRRTASTRRRWTRSTPTSTAKVAAGEQEARDAPEPDPAVLETQVWADGGSSWRN